MNNQEAIFELIKYRRRLEEDSTIDAEPFDIAIEALRAQQWIPCSERLPSAEHNLKGFLTTIKCYDENDVFIQVYENGKFGHWDGEKLIPNDDVIAWMEMPEPYMEEES